MHKTLQDIYIITEVSKIFEQIMNFEYIYRNYYTKTSKSLTLSRECAKTISKEEPIQGSVCWFSNFICFEILFVRI